MPLVKEFSVMLMVVAAICFGIALGDIIYTRITICDDTPACDPASIEVILTYVGSGLWASLFVFIAGTLGLWFVADPYHKKGSFMTLLFLCAVFFIPAMTVISAVMIYMVLTETPGATATTSLFDFGTPQDGYVVKFILPVCLVIFGLIEFFVAAGLLVYLYSLSSKEIVEEEEEMPVVPMPARPIISPGFGYYYPSRIYELKAGTPGYSGPQFGRFYN